MVAGLGHCIGVMVTDIEFRYFRTSLVAAQGISRRIWLRQDMVSRYFRASLTVAQVMDRGYVYGCGATVLVYKEHGGTGYRTKDVVEMKALAARDNYGRHTYSLIGLESCYFS